MLNLDLLFAFPLLLLCVQTCKYTCVLSWVIVRKRVCLRTPRLAKGSCHRGIIYPFNISVSYSSTNIDTALSSERPRQLEQMHKQVTAYRGCEIQKEGRAGEGSTVTPAGPELLICLKETREFVTHPPSMMHVLLHKGFATFSVCSEE